MVGVLGGAVKRAYPQDTSWGYGMQAYTVEIVFAHTAEDLDWREVEANSRSEAESVARTQFSREAFGTFRDAAVVSVTAQEIPQRRYRLDLGSNADDLDVEEVGQ